MFNSSEMKPLGLILDGISNKIANFLYLFSLKLVIEISGQFLEPDQQGIEKPSFSCRSLRGIALQDFSLLGDVDKRGVRERRLLTRRIGFSGTNMQPLNINACTIYQISFLLDGGTVHVKLVHHFHSQVQLNTQHTVRFTVDLLLH